MGFNSGFKGLNLEVHLFCQTLTQRFTLLPCCYLSTCRIYKHRGSHHCLVITCIHSECINTGVHTAAMLLLITFRLCKHRGSTAMFF